MQPAPPFGSARSTLWPETPPGHAPRPATWEAAITVVAGVGEATAERARVFGVGRVCDLLEHLPVRHMSYEDAKKVRDLIPGEEATVRVRLSSIEIRPTRRRGLRLVRARVADETGPLMAIWFNQDYLARQLNSGDLLLLRGKVDPGAPRQLTVKTHEVLGQGISEGLHTTGLVPVYAATEEMPARRLREVVDAARPLLRAAPERLPAWMRVRLHLPTASDALGALHFPRTAPEPRMGRRRLAFEELLVLQLGLAAVRRLATIGSAPVIGPSVDLVPRITAALPFTLTAEQQRVGAEIIRDLGRGHPMRRLLQGEVGSGKTIVAALAMAHAAEAGAQAALLVPTETLAEQHLRSLDQILAPVGIVPVLLTGRIPAAERARRLELLATGTAAIAVGTQALLTETVRFDNLGLVVVDEQHRFGVAQRQLLAERAKGTGGAAHLLYMSATPIPRTLALTAFGDLQVSTLRGRPVGRGEIPTRWVPEAERALAEEEVRAELRAGRQAYVICPLVEEGGVVAARAATEEAARLAEGPFKNFTVGLAHGAQSSDEKRRAMAGFSDGSTDILVATTVVEVGVDIANASIIIIEGADRFGLAQLHQLRGRVGRGAHPGRCLLFAEPTTETAIRRLEAISQEQDGLRLAELDLEIRGEGTVLGLRQSGATDLRFAKLGRDRRELAQARKIARQTLARDPHLTLPEHLLLREAVLTQFAELPRLLDA